MPFRKHASLVVVADGHTSVTEQLGGAVHRGTLERRARGLRTPAVEVGVTLRSTPEAPWLGRTPCWDRAFGEVIRSEGGPWGGPGSWRPGALPRCDGAQRQTCMAGEDVWGTRATRGGGGSPRDARRGWEVTRAKRGHGLPAPSQPQRGPARRQAPSTTGPEGERRQSCNPGAPARGLLSSPGGSVPGPPLHFVGARPRSKISLGLVAPVALMHPPPTVTAQVRRAPQSHAGTARRLCVLC